MFLSVIIPTRNRAHHLEGALSSLGAQTQTRESFEVLVVDNGSTDHTRDVCETSRAFLPKLKYLYDPRPGLHVGRHMGLNSASADILVYADDDIEAFPTWLEGIAEAFSDDQVALVGGKNLPKFQLEPPAWIRHMWEKERRGRRTLPYLSILDLGDRVKGIRPYDVFGCNFSIRKSILLEAGGFHPDAMPMELIRYRGDGETYVARYIAAHGYKALYHPKASVYHLVPEERLSESYFRKRAFIQGISDSYTDIRRRMTRSSQKRHYFKLLRWLLLPLEGVRRVRIRVNYLEGYCFHQDEVEADAQLYEWVTVKHYMGELPVPVNRRA